MAFAVAVFALAASSATAITSYTWTGAASAANWSNGTNWGGSAPSGSVGTLSFPALGSGPCIDVPPTDTCYTSSNDVTGLSANAITLDDGAGDNGSGYNIYGDSITLGAGGLTASTTGSSRLLTNFRIPLTLSADQTWSIDDNALVLEGAVAGGGQALTIDTASNGEFIVGADIEAGTVTLGGTIVLYGNRSDPEGQINGTTGNPVSVDGGILATADNGGTSGIGAFTTSNGALVEIGDEGGIAGQLLVNGGATIDSSSGLSLAYGGAGTTAGTDYSQLSASGPVNLGGDLYLYGSVPSGSSSACVPLTKGNVATLVTTTGTLSGTFNGIPDGTVIPVYCSPASGTAGTVQINYTATAVTATVISVGTTPPPTCTNGSTGPYPACPLPVALLPSATQVSCNDENTGLANEYFQCTAQVADASGEASPQTPTGTVSFAISSGGAGGFSDPNVCTLAPSQSGPTSYCSINYVPSAPGAIPVGSQPPLTAAYSGSSVFSPSTAQLTSPVPTTVPPGLLQVEESLCADVYTLNCSGIVALPAELADICVSVSGCDTSGNSPQSDGAESVTISPDQESLVTATGCPTVSSAEMTSYIQTGDPLVAAKLVYIQAYNDYTNQVNFQQATTLQGIQDAFAKAADKFGGSSNQVYTAANVIYTQQIQAAFAQAAEAGTDTSNVSVTLNSTWTAHVGFTPAQAAAAQDVVQSMQDNVNGALKSIAEIKAYDGVNKPYVPPTPVPPKTTNSLLARPAATSLPRDAKPARLHSFVLAGSSNVRLVAGHRKKIKMPISKLVRRELKQLWNKGIRTLHGHLVVQIRTPDGSNTIRTIPLTIHIAKPKPKHKSHR